MEDIIYIFSYINKLTDDHLNENKLHLLKDHANWPIVMINETKYEIVKLCPFRVINHNFPTTVQDDGSKRKFLTKLYYHRNLINGEQINKFWLIYSKLEECVLCYCCKLFSNHANFEKETSLISKGTNDWRHLSEKRKCQERSISHYKSVEAWMELNTRISKRKKINQLEVTIMERENKSLEKCMEQNLINNSIFSHTQ